MDQFTEPKSDIQIRADPTEAAYGPANDDGAEFHFAFIANNRGDDNGYVESARIIRFEFSETEDFSDPDVVECEDFTTPTGERLSLTAKVYLEDNCGPYYGLVPKGEVSKFKGTSDVYAGNLHEIYSEYYSMRAVMRFQCKDNSREYQRTAPTNRIEVW